MTCTDGEFHQYIQNLFYAFVSIVTAVSILDDIQFDYFYYTRHYGALSRAFAARSGSEGTLGILCIDPTPKSGEE